VEVKFLFLQGRHQKKKNQIRNSDLNVIKVDLTLTMRIQIQLEEKKKMMDIVNQSRLVKLV